MRRRRLIAALCAMSAVGCATTSSSNGTTPVENQRVLVADESHEGGRIITTSADLTGVEAVVAAPMDKVWDALLAAYKDLGIEVLSMNRPIGELGNRNFRMPSNISRQPRSRYFNCGIDPLSGPQANVYPIDASMLTVMKADTSGTTRLETRLTGSARKTGVNADPLYCATTGNLELVLADAVRKHLAQ
jgi:hypothetical protein